MLNKLHIQLLIAAALFPAAAGARIVVSSQNGFDTLGADILRELETGVGNVEVQINPGNYYFAEDHILLRGINFPNSSVVIAGRDAVVMSKGVDYHSGDLFEGRLCYDAAYLYQDGTAISAWSRTYTAESTVEVVCRADKLCRIKADFEDVTDGRDAYIRLTRWYSSSVYPIKEIKDGYIYYVAADLAEGYGGDWNVNDDNN